MGTLWLKIQRNVVEKSSEAVPWHAIFHDTLFKFEPPSFFSKVVLGSRSHGKGSCVSRAISERHAVSEINLFGTGIGRKITPLRESAKVKNFYMLLEKATAADGDFFAFDLGKVGTLVYLFLALTLGEPSFWQSLVSK